MKAIYKIIFPLFLLLAGPFVCSAQQKDANDVVVPISKYILNGDSEALSAWFDDNLEVAVLTDGGIASKAQAKQIIKTFFKSYGPQKFSVTHTAGSTTKKYILADLIAGGESFNVNLFLSRKNGLFRIQQLKISRSIR